MVLATADPSDTEEVPDDKIWAAMTVTEQRKWIEKNTNIELDKTPTADV